MAGQLFREHREDQVEAGDPGLDQTPLVDPAGRLEEDRFRMDSMELLAHVGPLVRLEHEGPRGPGEEEIHRLLDLGPDVFSELGGGDEAHIEEQVADPAGGSGGLEGQGLIELLAG